MKKKIKLIDGWMDKHVKKQNSALGLGGHFEPRASGEYFATVAVKSVMSSN